MIRFNKKPSITPQYGALVMAFVPYLYGIFASEWIFLHFWLGASWLFIYLFSCPFFALFSRKSKEKYQKWAIFYAIIAALFALPLLFFKFSVLQFLVPIFPLVFVHIYYSKQQDERNLLNDFAGILIFGIVGMVSFYLPTNTLNFAILLHPTLFFIAMTLYVKSVARERKNPRYLRLSLVSHLLLTLIYGFIASPLFYAYLVALGRAIIVPKQKWNIKQVGLFEFPITLIFLIGLMFS